MAKLILDDLANLSNEASAVDTINDNNAEIETAMENTLSRDGSSPNAMAADLDMDSNRILNLPEPASVTEPLRLMDLPSFQLGAAVSLPVGGTTGQALTKDSDDNFDVEWSTINKSWVGLGNVDNTSDANKPVSTAQAAAIAVVQSDVDTHEARTDNPHSVTKTQVSLGNVTNDAQLKIASNLADLNNVATARTNLGLAAGGGGDIWVEKAGDVMTGALQVTTVEVGHATDTTLARSGAGDVTIEGNQVYRAGGTDVPVTDGGTGASTAADARTNLGLVAGGAGDIWVEKAGDTMTGSLDLTLAGGSNINITVNGEAGTTNIIHRTSTDATPAQYIQRKSRGTIAARSDIVQNDVVAEWLATGRGGGANRNAGVMRQTVICATPSGTDMETRYTWLMPAAGSVTNTEGMRFDHATGFSLYGANPVIDQNRHHALRSYTTAGLPAVPTAGRVLYTSDMGDGALTFSNGTAFQHIAAGTYTPTLTGVTNVAASTAYECQYMRVGRVVTVSGQVDVDPTAANTLTQLGISLPIASNFANSNECGGTAASENSALAGEHPRSGAILGDAANNRAQLGFFPSTSDDGNRAMYFTFTYRII